MTKSFFVIFLIALQLFAQNFLRTSGKQIIDANGNTFFSKGIALGGWLMPEGYMLHMENFANSPSEIKSKIIELIGEENTEVFFDLYRKNFITKRDIDSIAALGFNTIRLPMHYELMTPRNQPFVYIEKGFEYIDSLISWCRPHNLYIILDLHAAPGGQSDEPISDYDPAFPSLWESETNKLRTIDLWKQIAQRYFNEPVIAGYDLLNEPKWDLGVNNEPLRDLYVNITNAIRQVDTNHIIFVEGNWFATDFTGLTPPWDENLVYTFHKYWNEVSQNSINDFVSIRENFNAPIWLGETGENSNAWFTETVTLMNENGIGWNWWTWKKLDAISVMVSAQISPQFQILLDYWNGIEPRPSEEFADAALVLQAENLKIENCSLKKDVADAIFRQPYEYVSVPFGENHIPGKIYFTEYDLGSNNIAYRDIVFENTGNGSSYNNGWSFRNDGVDIEACEDSVTNGYNVGWIENGEWLLFSVIISEEGSYEGRLRIASLQEGGKIIIYLDGEQISDIIDIPNTGGWQNWQTLIVPNLRMREGNHNLLFKFFFGGFNLNYMDFTRVSAVNFSNISNLRLKLGQNFPNPFNPTTTINYEIFSDAENNGSLISVNLALYNIIGQKVVTLVNKKQLTGKYSLSFDAANLASGTYFYRLTAGKFSETKKLIIAK